MSGLVMQRDCSTCTYRSKPDDVDWSKEPCESCSLLTMGGSNWPMWTQRTVAQFKSDADAGHKVVIHLKREGATP